MKKLLTSWLLLLVLAPAYADGFGANDKILYFNSDVLINVIKKTFVEELQLDVANKYVSVMDDYGNVSISDLVSVCAVGKLDNVKCRMFISDLIAAGGGNALKPFYWSDYVSQGFESGSGGGYNSGDGYFHNSNVLGNGDWALQFSWMKHKYQPFRKQYPDIEYLLGTSACTSQSGIKYVAADKNFSPNEQSGEHCWCKMTVPEQSLWVYYEDKSSGVGGSCARSCARGCMTSVRDFESMRAAMFTEIKISGSVARNVVDTTIQKALVKEFKPCEFDWAKETVSGKGKVWWGHKTKKLPDSKRPVVMKSHQKLGGALTAMDRDESTHYALNADGLNNEEWAVGGFNWMKSDNFQCKYPGVTKIKGVATCNKETGKEGQTTNKSFRANEMTGPNCWCKIMVPEQSKWQFLVRFNNGAPDTQEEIQYGMEVCDSSCLRWCSMFFNELNYPEQSGLFRSIGKK